MNIDDLPFNRFIGITRAEKEGCVLCLPGDMRYTNHLGTVHASALLALAEATSGDYLIKELTDLAFDVLPVVRRVEAKFRKPAFGAVSSTISVALEKKEEFLATLMSRGRALFEIPVDVFDQQGTHALSCVVEWFVAKKERKNSFRFEARQ
jgi:acyl-coenzyme A thioesterase PaaI-like protein